MAQVVTNENLVQLIQTGSVPEFKPPGAETKPAAAETKPANAETKPANGETPPANSATRDASGRFTKPSESATTSTTVEPAKTGKAEVEGDEGDDNLPEHVRKVIGKKHRAMKEAEEFAREEWRRAKTAEERAEKLQRQLEEQNAKSRPAAPKEPATEPKASDFATVAEYTDALVKYRVAETLKAEREQREREEAERAAQTRAREYGERVNAAKGRYDDFDAVVRSLSGTDLDNVHPDVVEYLQESEHGPDLLYHLGKHPDELRRLRTLSPRRFIAGLGKLEVQFERKPNPEPKPGESPTKLTDGAVTQTARPVSKAPAPIVPLDTAGAGSVVKDPEKMSVSELRAFRRQEELARNASRR